MAVLMGDFPQTSPSNGLFNGAHSRLEAIRSEVQRSVYGVEFTRAALLTTIRRVSLGRRRISARS